MIGAVIFDLDGTLVQTEILKAKSYAQAALLLCPGLDEERVIAEFKAVVGLPRQQVASLLLERLGLEAAARTRLEEFGVQQPWQAFVQVRLQIYEAMLDDPDTLLQYRCPHNTAFLEKVRHDGYKTGLATMSYCQQAQRVLSILELEKQFDFIASRDDVERGKPDPEIYLLVAGQLGVQPENCLVVEDSVSGVQAALNAGMNYLVVTTDFTRAAIQQMDALDRRWIVDDPQRLGAVGSQLLKGLLQ